MTSTSNAPAKKSSQDVVKELGGETFTLRFSYRSVKFLQDLWKLKTDTEVQEHLEANGDDADIVTDLLWSMLIAHHRTITRDECFEIVDAMGPMPMLALCNEVVTASLPPEPADPQPDGAKSPAT